MSYDCVGFYTREGRGKSTAAFVIEVFKKLQCQKRLVNKLLKKYWTISNYARFGSGNSSNYV